MHTPTRRFLRGISFLLYPLALSLAGTGNAIAGESLEWDEAKQMILVITPDWNADHGTLRRFERSETWRAQGDINVREAWDAVGEPMSVTVGRAGIGWGIGMHTSVGMHFGDPKKAEGDGRAPAGVFELGNAFGYTERTLPHMRYEAMQATQYCIDVADSPLYNRIVDTRDVGIDAIEGSTEPMRRDIHVDGDQRYKLGFVIGHNFRNVPAAGSCIFAHLWSAPGVPTSGCTAMAEADMAAILEWTDPARRPVFVQLPQAEYARLREQWYFPVLAPDAP